MKKKIILSAVCLLSVALLAFLIGAGVKHNVFAAEKTITVKIQNGSYYTEKDITTKERYLPDALKGAGYIVSFEDGDETVITSVMGMKPSSDGSVWKVFKGEEDVTARFSKVKIKDGDSYSIKAVDTGE